MLWMIQRVFYGKLGVRSEEVTGWDLTAREHLELWPFAALFLVLGVASPLFMRAIDTYGTTTAAPTLKTEGAGGFSPLNSTPAMIGALAPAKQEAR